MSTRHPQVHDSAFNKTRLPPELRRVLSCKSPAVFMHFLLEEKGPWGPFYQLRQVLAKRRHLLQILLKALKMTAVFSHLEGGEHGLVVGRWACNLQVLGSNPTPCH